MVLLCLYGPKAAQSIHILKINALVDEFHDYRDSVSKFIKSMNGEIDGIEVSRHFNRKPVVLDESIDFAHIIDSLGTGLNANSCSSGK